MASVAGEVATGSLATPLIDGRWGWSGFAIRLFAFGLTGCAARLARWSVLVGCRSVQLLAGFWLPMRSPHARTRRRRTRPLMGTGLRIHRPARVRRRSP